MGIDKALVATVAAMVILVLLNQPLLALLAGLLGVIFVAGSGERYASFPEVDMPEAGGYPKFDFWKDLVKDTGEFLGGLSKKFLRTDVAVDQWSSWVKGKVYGSKSDTGIYMFGPYAMVLPKSFAKDMHKLSHISLYMNALNYLGSMEAQLVKAMEGADDETKREIAEQIRQIKEAKEKLLEQLKNQT